VKEIYALAEDLSLMVLLDPEALSRLTPPESLLKDRNSPRGTKARHEGGLTWADFKSWLPESEASYRAFVIATPFATTTTARAALNPEEKRHGRLSGFTVRSRLLAKAFELFFRGG
jgi:hypothetical protein